MFYIRDMMQLLSYFLDNFTDVTVKEESEEFSNPIKTENCDMN